MDLSTGIAVSGTAPPALDPARFAIGGATPARVLRPASREELAEALRRAAREGWRVVPWGGGVALPREAAPESYDVALDLGALDRVVEYDPEDFTLTAECGVPLATLAATLAARGQELPLEGAHAARATLGGVLAANASGPRRYRFGAPRDRILGARFALADGTIVRTGGRVVKNVAGYGIHRLLVGSRGGLAILVEASLKLAPAPEARRALIYSMGAGEIVEAARWSAFRRLEPAFVTVVGAEAARGAGLAAADAAFVVAVGLEDDRAWVERQSEVTLGALGTPPAWLAGAEVVKLASTLADLEERAAVRLSFTTARNDPAALAPLIAPGAPPVLDALAGGIVFHAPAGRLHVFPRAEDAASVVATLAAHGFGLIDARGTGAIEPPLAPLVAVAELRSRIRAALDPAQTLALGARWERGAC